MATQQYAASVQGVAVRVTRLDAAGNLLTGTSDSYTTSSFTRVSFTPEYEDGDEITEKAADGTICVSFKAPDTLKRVTMEIAICEPDPEFTALVSGGVLLTRTVDGKRQSVGWASAQVGEDPSRDGVAVEVWSYAVINGKKAGVNPYYQWIFPYVKVRQSGDRVIENGLLANTFEGFGLGNESFGSGIDGRWRWPAATDRPYLYSRVDWAPVGYKGFYTWVKNGAGEGTPVTELEDSGDGTNTPGSEGYNPSLPIDLVLDASDSPAISASTGAPGTFNPSGSTAPATVDALISSDLTASPATAWASGQYVQTGTVGAPGEAHWSGTAWVAGRAV